MSQLDFADAEHAAYSTDVERITHRRRVLFVKPRYWVLIDDLYGTKQHTVQLRFQLAEPEVAIDAPWTRVGRAGHRGLLIRTFADTQLDARVIVGDLDSREGWLSRDYGQRSPAPVLICSAATRFPLRIVTLLLPVQDVGAVPGEVVATRNRSGSPDGLLFEDSGERVLFDADHRSVQVSPPGAALED